MEPFDTNGTIKKRSYNVNSELVDILKVVITSIDDAQTNEIIPDAQITSNLRHSNVGALRWDAANEKVNMKYEHYDQSIVHHKNHARNKSAFI